MKQNELIAYAASFSSYLIQNIKDATSINQIILFGSAARGDFNNKSDVDIFIDTANNLEKEINLILESFYDSILYKNYWKLLGITKEISIKSGKIEEWDLKRSIISHGIILYSKYKEDIKGKLYALITIEVKGKQKDNLKIWRNLYGYKQKINKKEYIKKGLIKQLNAKRIAPTAFIVSLNNIFEIKKFLETNKIKYKIIEFQSDSPVLD